MSEEGKEKARALLRLWAVEQRVLEEGRTPLSVDLTLGDRSEPGYWDKPGIYEQHEAVRVDFACGWSSPIEGAHGGCGRRWAAVKLACDPDPPSDPRGEHEDCVRLHVVECRRCRDRQRAGLAL